MSGEAKSKEDEGSRSDDSLDENDPKAASTTEGGAEGDESASKFSSVLATEGEQGTESGDSKVDTIGDGDCEDEGGAQRGVEPSEASEAVGSSIEPSEGMSLSERRKKRKKKSKLRAYLSAFHRMIAFGLLVVIASSMVNWVIALRVLVPRALAGGPIFGEEAVGRILAALVSQVGILVVLPVFAWCVAWVLVERPFRFAIGAAVFTELWSFVIGVMSGGAGSFLWDPINSVARYFFVLVAGVLGGLAFIHGRRMADRYFPPEVKKDPKRPAPS